MGKHTASYGSLPGERNHNAVQSGGLWLAWGGGVVADLVVRPVSSQGKALEKQEGRGSWAAAMLGMREGGEGTRTQHRWEGNE